MTTEKEYVKHVALGHRKKFAQFFTPEQIADFMASWILDERRGAMDILEPAFGLGIFSRSICKYNTQVNVVGYDIDKIIYTFATKNFVESGYNITIKNENYLTTSWSEKFDGIICNPPYLKFHDYDNTSLVPLINNKLDTHLNCFTNIYTLFLLKSIYQMKDNGRLAYIIPSEFLNSDYGVEVKRTLLQSGVLKHIIIVDFTQCAFDDALTTACILLCQKSGNSSDIHFSNIKDINNLTSSLSNYTTYSSSQLNPEIKWKYYYEKKQSSKYSELVPFSTFAKVSRGIATGANDYFTFKSSKIDSYSIPRSCFKRCICHASDVQNQIFTKDDFEKISDCDKTVYLFNGCADESEPHVRNYINFGEQIGVNKKHLTSKRNPWYSIENRPPSPIWVTVFNRNGLKFVRNKADAYNLTTFHCVYSNDEIDTEILFAYLLTNVAQEILLENSRQYGNGLIKFEPNDLNKGKVLNLKKLSEEEKKFVSTASDKLQYYGRTSLQVIDILNDFFQKKFSRGATDLSYYSNKLAELTCTQTEVKSTKYKATRIKQLNLFDLFEQYANTPIVENCIVHEDTAEYNFDIKHHTIDYTKNCLISLVKKDNFEQYEKKSAEIYYTGKKFPAAIATNELYYFMPYLKGKGIRDLYFIKTARIGNRKEGQSGEDRDDFRLVFEIEFVKQLFNDYRPMELKIWRAFTDTKLRELIEP